jgi:hypothetical protein
MRWRGAGKGAANLMKCKKPRARAKLETVPGEGFLSKRQRQKIAREVKKRIKRQ